MTSIWIQDVRFAVRSLKKSPILTVVSILSLALGIGANTAIFSLVDQVLLRALPVKDPRSLVMVATEGSHTGSNRGANAISYFMYKDYRERNEVFEGILCRRGEVVNVGYESGTERAEAELVSGNYFEVLGVAPALGRVFTLGDERAPGADPVVVLAYDYWRNRFSGDRAILGQSIRVNGFPMTVVGVAQPGFEGVSLGFRPRLYVPVTMKKQVTPSWDDLENRRSRWLQVFARLKRGVSREAAEASIGTLYKQIIALEVQDPYFDKVSPYYRDRFLESHAVVLPGGRGYSGARENLKTPLRVLMCLVGLVLLITCANVSNLMVAKATGRTKEIAMRLALGAGRAAVVQQLLVESVLLALAGGLLGLALAYWTTRGLILFAPTEQMRESLSAQPDARILLFALSVSAATALVFGLLPALQAARTDLVSTMKQQSGAASAGQGSRARKTLVVVQVFLALLLLLGSGLFVRSLRNLHRVDPGFQATNLIRFKLDPPLSGYDVQKTKEFYRSLRERLEATGGVSSAGLAVVAIMEGDEWDSTVSVEGYSTAEGEDMNPHFNSISPRYFETLGLRVMAGRDFTDGDDVGSTKAILVNETFAKKYFKDSPLGYHIGFGGPQSKPDMEIVGIVEDAKYENLREEVPRQIFVAYRQADWASEMTVYVRTSLPSEAMFATIRKEVASMDATMPIFDLSTMEDQLDRSLSVERLVALLSSAFGLLATLLAFMGLYGVTAFGVTRRSSEIGLRMALGAEGTTVVGMVLKEVLILAGIGVGFALPVALWLTKLVQSQLYGVAPRDPATVAFATLALLAVTVAAGAIPALRASRLSPVSVLRYE
jgi:putative ABC transport system permease protein